MAVSWGRRKERPDEEKGTERLGHGSETQQKKVTDQRKIREKRKEKRILPSPGCYRGGGGESVAWCGKRKNSHELRRP